MRIHQDTGAWQSLITSKVLEKLKSNKTGQQQVIKTVVDLYPNMPMHRLNLKSKFLTGEVHVLLGETDEIPFSNIDVSLGNDLTNECCAERN